MNRKLLGLLLCLVPICLFLLGGNGTRRAAPTTAPGMIGSTATETTLQWLWGLERVPFPQKIDQGQWTDYYFSSEAGGLWPEGDDANPGTSPDEAFETIDAATVCFTSYARCNFDHDTWDVADGWAGGIGTIEDADITLGDCPVDTFESAHEQPCFWFRSAPGGRATFDADGTPNTDKAVAFRTEARAHILVEGIDTDSDSASAAEAPWDTFERAIVTVVGSNLRNVRTSPQTTDNVFTAHDVSVSHIYGNADIGYENVGGVPAADAVGLNASGAVAIHVGGTISTVNAGRVFGMRNVNIADAAYQAEAEITEPALLITGAKMIGGASGIGVADANASSGSWNGGNVILIGTASEPSTSATGVSNVFDTNPAGNSNIQWVFIHSTTMIDVAGGTNRHWVIGNGDMETSDIVSARFASYMYEYSRNKTVSFPSFLRILDDDWADSASVIRIVDTLHEDDSVMFTVVNTTGDCNDDTTANLISCLDTHGGTAVVAALNVTDSTPQETGTAVLSATATTLTVSGTPWTADEWAGAVVKILTGTGSIQSRRVTTNTNDTLTVGVAWDTNPAASDTFSLTLYGDPTTGVCLDHRGAECADLNTSGSTGDYAARWPERVQCPGFICGIRATGFQGSPTGFPDTGALQREPWSTR